VKRLFGVEHWPRSQSHIYDYDDDGNVYYRGQRIGTLAIWSLTFEVKRRGLVGTYVNANDGRVKYRVLCGSHSNTFTDASVTWKRTLADAQSAGGVAYVAPDPLLDRATDIEAARRRSQDR
jgi:hypothetical protein